jgi:hypothetical protein
VIDILAKLIYKLLTIINDMKYLATTELELNTLLNAVLLSVDRRSINTEVSVSIGVDRALKMFEWREGRIECRESDLRVDSIELKRGVIVFSRSGSMVTAIPLDRVKVSDILFLACNTTPEELDKLAELVKEKREELEEHVIKPLKELVAYAKLMLS